MLFSYISLYKNQTYLDFLFSFKNKKKAQTEVCAFFAVNDKVVKED